MKMDLYTMEVLNHLNWVASATQLTFDGPGTQNWRKSKGAYKVYFRSLTCDGNPLLAKLRKGDMELKTRLEERFETVEFKGGCADLGASFKVSGLKAWDR